MAYGTAWGGIVQAGGLADGEDKTVLVSAASSSVGLASIALAKDRGARVIATTRSAQKVDALFDAGADDVIATESEDLETRVMEATEGHGFDIAFDPVNGPFVEKLARAAAPGGKLVEYGLLAGEVSLLPFDPMLRKGLSIQTFHLGFDVFDHVDRFVRLRDELLAKLESGVFRAVVDRRFDLDQIRLAYQRLASNQQFGKIVVEVSD